MIIRTFNINNLTQADYEKWYALMSPEKKLKVDRIKIEDKKKCSVAGEMLARKMISRALNISVEEISFKIGTHGKPYADKLPIHFNISHSGNMVVCGISKFEIGVDIEEIRPIDLKIANKICLPNELEYIHADEHSIYKRLFEIWTGKEACFKCRGTGITDFKSVDTLNDPTLCEPILMGNYIIRFAVANNE